MESYDILLQYLHFGSPGMICLSLQSPRYPAKPIGSCNVPNPAHQLLPVRAEGDLHLSGVRSLEFAESISACHQFPAFRVFFLIFTLSSIQTGLKFSCLVFAHGGHQDFAPKPLESFEDFIRLRFANQREQSRRSRFEIHREVFNKMVFYTRVLKLSGNGPRNCTENSSQ